MKKMKFIIISILLIVGILITTPQNNNFKHSDDKYNYGNEMLIASHNIEKSVANVKLNLLKEVILCSLTIIILINVVYVLVKAKRKIFYVAKTIKNETQLARCNIDKQTYVRYNLFIATFSCKDGGMNIWKKHLLLNH